MFQKKQAILRLFFFHMNCRTMTYVCGYWWMGELVLMIWKIWSVMVHSHMQVTTWNLAGNGEGMPAWITNLTKLKDYSGLIKEGRSIETLVIAFINWQCCAYHSHEGLNGSGILLLECMSYCPLHNFRWQLACMACYQFLTSAGLSFLCWFLRPVVS